MDGRNSSDVRSEKKSFRSKNLSRPISFQAVRNKQPDRTYYIRDKAKRIQNFFSQAVSDLYHSLWMTLSFDQVDFHNFKKFIAPIISSGAAFVVGEYVTTRMSRYYTDTDENDYIFKFILGAAILGYSATNRITEHKPSSQVELSTAITSDVLSITYLTLSTLHGSRALLEGRVSDNYALIASIGATGLAMPGAASYLAQKLQEKLVKRQYAKGAQRSDTALISAGSTPVANAFLQFGHHVRYEMAKFYRLFNLGLISHNILHTSKLVQQLRNFPALIADVGPPIVKKLIAQQEKIEHDYQYNTTTQKVLKFTDAGSVLVDIPRYQLRTGDLVYCDDKFDYSSAPVSGEIITLRQNESKQFINQLEIQKFNANLKAHNGEDIWIEHKTKPFQHSEYKKMDLHAIRDGKQAGILTGTKLNLYGGRNFFVRIKEEKERTIISNYEKKAVINQIINEHKRKNVFFAIIASIVMAGLVYRNPTTLPTQAIRLLFDLFQMTIPFSETFLREMVNSNLMKDLNQHIENQPLETLDALRIVDLCNALSGYYNERFPHGVAIISDKTGTLTTSKMKVLGMWTTDMKPDVQGLLSDEKSYLLPSVEKQFASFDVFISAYTNEKKELEPEEFSLLKVISELIKKPDFLKVDVLGNNHFRKTYFLEEKQKTIETFHLGLYRQFGGRFTLVADGQNKYLVFCGVPRSDKFRETELFKSYNAMNTRSGVLSRDWCIARTEISQNEFDTLKNHFEADQKQEIENYLSSNTNILNHFNHYCTFIIDNPVKKSAEKFISQCSEANIPVFVATGDTAKASENIAKVLCTEHTKRITTIRPADIDTMLNKDFNGDETVIFTGINDKILSLFQRLMMLEFHQRPVIIFSEMSTEGKGKLARHLKNRGYFVVANGDGTNDVAMMKNADFVIGHVTEDGTYAPGIGQFANLSDKQLQGLLHSDNSFYELFDIHHPKSQFIKLFTPMANSQEKPSMALLLKSSKMSFELAQSIGVPDVKEMWQQHWCSVAFDLTWLWISFNEINSSTELPADNQNLSVSEFPKKALLATLAIATLQSWITYATTGESTNANWMLLMLSFLPFILKSLFSAYGDVRDEIHPVVNTLEAPEEKQNPDSSKKKWGFFKSCFRKRPEALKNESVSQQLALSKGGIL